MSDIGHNNPPDMTSTATETASSINEWMKEHPAILSEDEAREAKVHIDRGRLCVKDLEAERDQKVRRLNEKVKEINTYYRSPRENLQKVITEIETRITSFLRKEERRRIEAAEKARAEAQKAEEAARIAESVEQERIDSARSGELGVDIDGAVRDADAAFKEFSRASRYADRADKATKVKLAGGFTRSISLKNSETLILVDAIAALRDIGVTDDIREAILKGARAYRKVWEELPDGIEVQVERKI